MTFVHPWLLALAALGPLPVLARTTPSASPARRAVKAALAGAALTLLLVALARPQLAGKRRIRVRGLDVAIAVDVSASMLVADVGPTAAMTAAGLPANRLGRARELAVRVMDALVGDRFAPIAFAGAAAHFPLTEDRDVAARMLYDVGPADLPQGSNLAEVFRVARCLLRPDLYDDLGCRRIGRSGHGGDPLPGDGEPVAPHAPGDDALAPGEERGKAILVITDGGDPDPAAAREVRAARELGIGVVVVGVGSTKGGVVYALDARGNASDVEKHLPDGSVVVSARDDGELRGIVRAAGDRARMFVDGGSGEVDAAPIVRALRALERGSAARSVHERRDVYQPVVLAALVLLVLEAAIAPRRRRAHPEAR